MPEQVRVDKWLWAVRVFKTRSAANEACSKGRVRVGDAVAKPASRVRVGDVVAVRNRGFTRTLRVDRLVDKRVGAAVAADCYEDLTPPDTVPQPKRASRSDRVEAAWGERDRGSGRPTKRDRRRMERFLRG